MEHALIAAAATTAMLLLLLLPLLLHLLLLAVAAVKYATQRMFGDVPLAKLTVPEAMLIGLLNTSCLPCLAVRVLAG